MWHILITLLVLSSVIVIPNILDNFWAPKNAVFLLLGFCLLGYNFISNKEKTLTFKNRWIGLILIYIILSFGWYFYKPLLTAKEGERVFWNIWNFLPTLNTVLTIFMIKDLVEYTDSLVRWITIAKVLCWICFGFSIYALLQFLGLDQIFTKDLYWMFDRQQGKYPFMITFMGNSMHSANFLAMLSPICLIFTNLRYKIIYILAFIAVLLSNSAISMLGFIIGFLVYLFFTKRIKFLFCILLLFGLSGIIFYQCYPQYFSLSGRFELWKIVIKGWMLKPFTGHGLGSFVIRGYRDSTTHLAGAAENDYLQILHDGGLFLLVLVGGYLIDLWKRIILSKDTLLKAGYVSGFVVFLTIAMGSFIISINPLALVGIIYISAIEVQV